MKERKGQSYRTREGEEKDAPEERLAQDGLEDKELESGRKIRVHAVFAEELEGNGGRRVSLAGRGKGQQVNEATLWCSM